MVEGGNVGEEFSIEFESGTVPQGAEVVKEGAEGETIDGETHMKVNNHCGRMDMLLNHLLTSA